MKGYWPYHTMADLSQDKLDKIGMWKQPFYKSWDIRHRACSSIASSHCQDENSQSSPRLRDRSGIGLQKKLLRCWGKKIKFIFMCIYIHLSNNTTHFLALRSNFVYLDLRLDILTHSAFQSITASFSQEGKLYHTVHQKYYNLVYSTQAMAFSLESEMNEKQEKDQ